MKNPTTNEVRTAIEVLKKLSERLNTHAAHSAMQMPDTRFGDNYAARVELRSIEQITRIETVAGQLEIWQDELREQRRHSATQHV